MSTPADRRSVLILLLVVATTSALTVGSAGTAAAQSQAPTAEEILDRVEQRYENAETVVGEAVVTTTNASGTTTANVSFAFAQPDSSRFVVERDGETYRAGTNGSVAWSVGPDGAAVYDADAAGAIDADRLPGGAGSLAWTVPTDFDAEDVTVQSVGPTEVDGVPAYEIDLGPANSSVTATTLWVAQDDYRVLRAATAGDNTLVVAEVRDVQFNVSVHESTFQPPDDRVSAWSIDRYDAFADAQNGTSLDLPRLDGGTFTGATVTTQGDETLVAQRYDLDGENVTLVSTTATERFDRLTENASTVDVDGRTASVTTVDDRSLVVWTDGNVTTAVSVDGPTDRAVEVARLVES